MAPHFNPQRAGEQPNRPPDQAKVICINFWDSRPSRFTSLVQQLDASLELIDRNGAEQIFKAYLVDEPDVVLLGYGVGSKQAATFIARYKASTWYLKIPLIAIVDSRDDSHLATCIEWGCDDAINKPIRESYIKSRVKYWSMQRRIRQWERISTGRADLHARRTAEFAEIVVPLGVAMMAETDFDKLLDRILSEAMRFCSADGGTLYLLSPGDKLDHKIIANRSMNFRYRESMDKERPPALESLLIHETDAERHIASYVARTGKSINIEDVYAESRFDFTGQKEFDAKAGYLTKSMLSIPLCDHGEKVIGVLQLINSMDPESGAIVSFDSMHQLHTESLSMLAGQAIESYRRMQRLRSEANARTIDANDMGKHKVQARR